MINKRISIWILLLTLAWPLFGAVRINEIMFDTGVDPDTEFIELYNDGAGDVNLEGWSLVIDGVTLVTFPADLTIAGGQYLAIYVGSPVAPPASSYSLGLTTPAIGDTGAEILLQDDNGNPHDYIAYGTATADPPSPLVFPSPISPGSWSGGDGLAFIEPDGTNSDDPTQWINRRSANVTPGTANTQQPVPTVSYGNITVPSSFPTVNACEEIEVPINVNYNHETPLVNAKLTFTLPSGFLFASASDSGVFDNTTRSVSWSADSLSGDRSVSVRVRPNCEITSGQFTGGNVELSFRRYPSQSPALTVNASNSSSSITIKQPDLEVKMAQYGTGNKAVIAEISTMVEFEIEVTNKGTAPLTGFGAYISLRLKDDLLFVAFRKDGPSGASVDYLDLNFIDSVFTGWTGAMDPGDTYTYYVKALNTDCAPELGSARVSVGWGCGDSEPGTQSCWNTVNSGASVLCPPTLTFEAPAGAPDVYMGCQNVTHHIVIGNSNGVPIKVTGLELSLPTDTYWISSKIGDTDVGTYDQATKTLTFTPAELTNNPDHYLPAHSDITIVLVMRPNCVANTDRRASGVFNYEFGCPFCGWLPGSTSTIGRGVPLLQPALAVTVQDPADPSKTTVLAERGETVTFKVVVNNNGLGDLDTDGKPEGEEGGWVELFNIGSGLALQSITDITGTATPVTWQLHEGRQRWKTGTMHSRTSRSYLVTFLVTNCIDVGYEVGTYWTCAGTHPDDHCRQDGESKGSVNIVLRNPSLTLGVASTPLVIDYCGGATLSIPVTNANEEVNGMARNVSINLVGLSADDFEIELAPGSPFTVSHTEDVATFSLFNGDDCDQDEAKDDIGRGHTFNLDFTVTVKELACNASSGGTLIYQPYYEDSCNIPYTSGTQISSFSRTPQAGASLSKTVSQTIVEVDDKNLTWTISLSYAGDPNATFEYTLIDDYPDNVNDGQYSNFTVTAVTKDGVAVTDYIDNGETITHNVNTTFDGNGNYNTTYVITFDAPTSACVGGRTYTNTVNVEIKEPKNPTDCKNCPLPKNLTASAPIVFISDLADAVDQHERDATYENLNANGLDNSAYQAAAEICSNVVFDQVVRFTTAAPANWEIDLGPGPAPNLHSIRFRDILEQSMRAPEGIKENLDIEIYYFSASWKPSAPSGTDYGPKGSNYVTWNDVTYNGSKVEIDLKGLDNIPTGGGVPAKPNDGGILWIRYSLQPQAASVGTFYDFAMVVMPDADLCDHGPESLYISVDTVTVAQAVPTLSIANISNPTSHHISRCEPLKLRFNLGASGGPFDIYDTRLVVNLNGNYHYRDNSTAISLNDEGGSAISSFEPSKDGDTLTWNIGDVRGLSGGGDHYIEIEVEKTCSETSTRVDAVLLSNNHCNQIPDGNGPGAATGQDTEISAITSFANSTDASYEPILYTGRLETRFASQRVFYNDAYPYVLLHAVNSGNGTLYNVRIPIELGSLINNTASLTFLEAHVVAVSGTTSAAVDLDNPITPVAYGDGAGYAHGHRKVTLGIDSMAPSSIVTIRLRLRMVLCSDLSLKIVGAHWGCSAGEAASCLTNLEAPELNSYMEIKSGSARVVVIEHLPTPVVLDVCGSTVRLAIEVLNSGSVNVYEPIIRERLPEGLQIVPDSVQYSIDGGPLTFFPEASGTGLRYTSLTTTTTPGIGPYQTIFWNFTDPDNDGYEDDSLLPSATFADPMPTDSLFNRHIVMKPATRLRIEFEAELDGCDNVAAYQKSDKRGEATLMFDLPCHHDDRVDANGVAVSPPRLPLDDNTREITLLDPGEVNVQVNLKGQNITQGSAASANQANAEKDDEIQWTVTLNSLGPGVVPYPKLELFVPSILTVDFVNHPPVIQSPTNIVFENSNPAGEPQTNPAGTKYTFVFENTDQDMIDAGRKYYFAATETVTITISSTLNTCVTEKPTLEARLHWGCCPELAATGGQYTASMPIKSRADVPTVKITEGDGGSLTKFDSCLGAYTITITSPATNRDLSLWNLDVSMTLPPGWAYAPLSDDGTNFIYAGTYPRPEEHKLLPTEEEPNISADGKTLRWTYVTNGGKIDDTRARIFPREELKIVVYLKADGSNINCDLTPTDTHPTIPEFTQVVSVSYKDSCGNPLDSPKEAQVSIKPENAKLKLQLIPTPSTYFISNTDTEVYWILRLTNTSNTKTATNIQLDLEFGDGYSSVSFNSGTPSPTQSNNSFAWPIGVIAELAPDETKDWRFTGYIDTTNRRNLTAHAIVRGHCFERDGITQGCAYSYQELTEYVSGAAIAKTIDGTCLAAPAVSTIPGASNAAATAANVTVGTILRNVIRVDVYEGGSTNLIVRDVLPSGLQFLEANLVNDTGTLVASLTPTSTTDNIITFSHTTISQLANITGGRTDTNALFIEIWSRVDDNTTLVKDGEVLTNTAQLTVIRGTRTFDHTTPGITLHSANEITILEPFIQDDASLTKTSLPVSLPEDHAGAPLNIAARPTGDDPVAYTFTAKNTGTSPAYELEFTDSIPWQLEDPGAQVNPYELTVTITPDGGTARTLANTDFTMSWQDGANDTDPGTLKVNLLSTTDAILGVNETITIAYYGKIATFAPGTFVDNSGKITSYSSLPDKGATLTTARSTDLTEEADERVSYAGAYRPLPAKRTYHKFTSELSATGGIIAEITPMSDGAAPALRSDGTTRATIGEKVEYHLRLDLPSLIRLYDLSFTLDVPDGLTVDSAKWEIVATGNDFSGSEKTLSFTELATGITEVRGQAGTGANDFPQPINNASGSGQDMLVKVILRVDRSYNGGTPVLTGNSFSLPASFKWGEIGSVAIAPIPTFTIVEPSLSTLTKERNAHLQSDNSSAASYVGTGTYRNFNDKGPDNLNPTPKTDPVSNVYQVRADEIVEYKLTFRNDGDGAAWDVTLRDTVPAGMTLRTGSVIMTTNPVDAGISIITPAPAATLDFTINRVLPGHEVTVLYRCNVDTNVAAGRYLQNQANIIEYSSLTADSSLVKWPTYDRSVTYVSDSAHYTALGPVFEKVGTPFPESSKSVTAERTAPDGGTVRATIGEKVTYELRLNIPDTSTLYDLKVVDVVPDGLQVRSATYSINGATAVEMDRTVNDADGTTTVSATTNPFNDVSGFTGVADDIVITIVANVKQAYKDGSIVDTGDVFANNATFTWNQVDDDDSTVLSQEVAASDVTFTIVEPKLVDIEKTRAALANPATFGAPLDGYLNYDPSVGPNPNASAPVDNVDVAWPGQTVRYTLTIRNTGDGIAYYVDLVDTVPVGMSYVGSSATVSAAPNATAIAFRSTPAMDSVSRKITFQLNQLEPGNTATIIYDLKVDTPVAAGRFLLNKAKLDNYRSLPNDSSVAYPDDARDITTTSRPPAQLYDGLEPAWTCLGTAFPEVSKTVQSEFTEPNPGVPLSDGTVRGSIGEVMTYELLVNIPENHILYDLHILDQIPANLTVQNKNLAGSAYITYAEINGTSYNVDSASSPLTVGADNKVAFYLESDVAATTGSLPEIKLVIAVTVDNVAANVAGTTFENNMTVSWNQVDENPGAATGRSTVNSFIEPAPTDTPDSVDFTLVEPYLDSDTLKKERTGHYESNGTTNALSPGFAQYNNYNPRGPLTHLSAQDPVPNVYQVRTTEILEFTAKFTNTGTGRAYDIRLTDYVPAGFTLVTADANAPTISGGTTPGTTFSSGPIQTGGSGNPITFTVNWLDPGQTCVVTFRTQIEPGVGVGVYLQDELVLNDFGSAPASSRFPDLERDTTSTPVVYTAPNPKYEKVGTQFPTSSKTVESQYTGPTGKRKDGLSRASIGEAMTYELRLDVLDTSTLYDLEVVDVVPDGLQVQSASYSINGGSAVTMNTVENADGTTTVSSSAFGDVDGVPGVTDEVIITIVAMVKQAYKDGSIVDAGDVFANNATFTWNEINNDPDTVLTRNFETSDVTFTIVEPSLETLTKDKAAISPATFGAPLGGYLNYDPSVGPNPNASAPVNNVEVASPDQTVGYTLTVKNGGDGIAYGVVLIDTIPVGMSYVAGTASATVSPSGATPTLTVSEAGQDLTFTLDELAVDDTVTITYQVKVAKPAPAGRFLLNKAKLHNYRSIPGTSTDARDIVTDRPDPLQKYEPLGPAFTYLGTAFPTASKAVESEFTPIATDGTVCGTIGEVMTYTLQVNIPDDHILYDLRIRDVIPNNLKVWNQDPDNNYITKATANHNGTATTYNAGSTQLTIDGQEVSLYLQNDDVQAIIGNDKEVELVIAVTVEDVAANVDGTIFENTMEVSWNQINESPAAPTGRTKVNSFIEPAPTDTPDSVDFKILEPKLAVTTLTKALYKHYESNGTTEITSTGTAEYNNYNPRGPTSHEYADPTVPNVRQVRPTEILEFTVTFKNTGNARAYDILLTDVVPPGLTLVKGGVNDPEVTGTTTTDIAFLNSTPEQPGGSGTPINFKVNWLNAGDTCEIKFRTQVESTVGVGAYLQNELSITDYGTTPDASATFPALERDTDSAVPYTDPHPKYEKVGTPFPLSSKTIESQYTGPTGKLKDGSSRGTIGERMTYELRLNIPDTTTLYDLTVTDVLPDGLQPYSATYSINGGPTDVAMTIDGQTVSCTTFSNVSGGGASVTDEIVITIVAIVKQAYSGGAAVKADDVFGNNATFTWKQVSGGGAATVWTRNFEPSNVNFTVLEPKLETLTKEKAPVAPATFGGPLGGYRNYETVGPNPNNSGPVNNVDVVKPGDEVLYTLTFINNGGSTAYDIDLTDIIPIGMSYVAGSASVSTTTAQTTAIAFRTTPTAPLAPNRNLVFELNLLESGKTAKIEYKLQVDTPAAAGRFLLNQVMLDNYRSLPNTMPAPADARDIETTTRPIAQRYSTLGPAVEYVGTAFPTATKAVRREFPLSPDSSTDTVHGTIGELMTYELKVDIPDNHILYDLQIRDVVPANLTVQNQNLVPAYITYADVNNFGATTRYNAGSTELTVAGSTVTLYLPSDVRAANGVTNEIQFEIAVTIDDNAANTAGVVKANTMEVSWNQVDQGSGVASGARNTLNSFVTPDTGTVDFTIIEPELLPDTLKKSRSGYFTSVGSPIAYLGTASYNNYNADGPESHLSKLSPVPNVEQVKPTDIVEYTVTFTNTGDARVYDILLTDYVPNGFRLLAGSGSVTGGTTAGINFINSTPAQAGGSGNPITFAVNWLDPGQTGTITFRTQIETGIAAGAYLQNKIVITDFGTTPNATAKFPDLERDTASAVPYTAPNPKYEKVGTQYPPYSNVTTSKTIQTELTPPSGKNHDGSSRATIGELITYEMLIDIPDNLQLFDLEFSDPLPDGLTAVSATYNVHNGPSGTITSFPGKGADGKTQITIGAATLGDIPATTGYTNEIVFTIQATVDQKFVTGGGSNSVANGSVINNKATLTWNQTNGVPSPSSQDHEAALTIVEPKIESTGFTKVITQVLDSLDGYNPVTTTRGHNGIVSNVIPKASNGKTSYYKYPSSGTGNPVLVDNVQVVLPEDYVEYKITVTNSGTARAFDIKISDILPRIEAVEYVSGTGTFDVNTLPYSSGTPNSKLTVDSTSVPYDNRNCTRLDFTIDVLEHGQSAVILYRVRVKRELGAGNYIGPNVANLEDYGSLPDGTFTVQVGNLQAGDGVRDNSLERDTTSDPAYAKRGPVGEDIGVQYPEFSTKIYRRYDIEGREITPPTALTAATNIRIGELLTYELTATLPRHTILFDGGASGNALAFRHRLNRGYHLLAGSEELSAGADGTIDLTGKLRGGTAPTPYPVISSQQYPTWYFDDIANTANTAQTARLRFEVEVRSKEYNDSPYFTDQKASVGQVNRSYLFWNTIDAAEKASFNAVADVNTGDHPFLQRDSVTTSVVQPNLQLFKDSVPEPNSFIGVTAGNGDLITYTLTLRNWNNATGAGNYQGRGTAYNAKITDILPKDIAPLDITGLTLTAAVHSINTTTGAIGGVVQNLTLDEDYTFTYAFNNTTHTGTITFTTIRDTANNDYHSRIEVNRALVITYEVRVNPDIGAQGAGAGKRVNYAMLENYYSFPEGLNDPDRKQYGPDGPRRVALLTNTPLIVKTSTTANASVAAGEIIEYNIVAPLPPIRSNLYDATVYDVLPDGLSFGGSGTVNGVGPGPVRLDIGNGDGQVPGDEVVVTGGRGEVSISVVGRRLDVNIKKIDAEGGGHDQVTVTVRCLVKNAFSNGRPIPRLHKFVNNASLLWYDDDVSFPDRVRYAVVSPDVYHFYNATGILFEPSQTGTAQPGTIRIYRHVLRNFENNDITVPITFSSTQKDWVWQLFTGDGNGNMVEGPYEVETLENNESRCHVFVPADGMTEVIMRVFVPTDITSMITDVLTVTATGGGNISTITDVTVTTAERIAVFKEVSTGTEAYATRIQVQPTGSNAVNQRIRFFNNGPENVKEVYIYDFIPNFTVYIANSAVNTPEYELQYSKDGGVNWTVGEPAAKGESVVDGTVPAVTNLRWYYNGGGVLTPGDEHVITFQLRIK